MQPANLNFVFPVSHSTVPEAVTSHLQRLGVPKIDLVAAKSQSLRDGTEEVAMIIRAGQLIAICDHARAELRIYDQSASQLCSVPMAAEHKS